MRRHSDNDNNKSVSVALLMSGFKKYHLPVTCTFHKLSVCGDDRTNLDLSIPGCGVHGVDLLLLFIIRQ